MADFSKDSAADMAAGNPSLNMGTTGSMHDIEWDAEDEYWETTYATRPYARADRSYAHYRPAYRYGAWIASQHGHQGWENVEGELARGWAHARGTSHLSWDEAKHAVRDAWDRVVHGRRDQPPREGPRTPAAPG
jgi:hypothetical protein